MKRTIIDNLEVNNYCIECCKQVKSLIKKYKDGFIDVIQCDSCNQIVDTYLECEYSVILIDLILLKQRAYRHIILNRKIQQRVLYKLLLLFLLSDAYLQWFHVKNRQFESIKSNDHQLFYELEWGFYNMLIHAILDYTIYALLLAIFILLKSGKEIFKKNLFCIIKALILSSFGKLMVVPLIIWNPNETYFNLAKYFTWFSNAYALSVATNFCLNFTIFVTLATNLIRIFLNSFEYYS